MDRKRCSGSRELLPYKSLFRGISEPKYDFRAPIPRKRPFPRRKKVVSNVCQPHFLSILSDDNATVVIVMYIYFKSYTSFFCVMDN